MSRVMRLSGAQPGSGVEVQGGVNPSGDEEAAQGR